VGYGPKRDEVDMVITGIFDINRRLGDISLDVRAIRRLLEENDGEEEGDEQAPDG
jgi:hypothetical protein